MVVILPLRDRKRALQSEANGIILDVIPSQQNQTNRVSVVRLIRGTAVHPFSRADQQSGLQRRAPAGSAARALLGSR